MSRLIRLLPVAAIALAAGVYFTDSEPVQAADHTDPPDRVAAGNSADIGDLYAWHNTGRGTLTVALTFAGPLAPAADQAGAYDSDILYGVHIDNSADNTPNFNVWIRFAQNDLGAWGVQVIGLPGTNGPVVGAVETILNPGNDVKVWAGLRDDPFFFDLQGFIDTTTTGDLSFVATRDFFAGLNITAVVLEMPLGAAQSSGDSLQVWATTRTL